MPRGSGLSSDNAAVSDWLGRSSVSGQAGLTSATPEDNSGRLILALTGWRRRCLFGLLLVLTIIVIINLSLTLWLLRSMQFSLDGIGNMRITPGGIQLDGEAQILDSLLTSQITSRKSRALLMDSHQNITFSARDTQGRVSNRLFLGDDRLEVVARDFTIKNSEHQVLFAANRREVVVGAETLRVSGIGGAVFEGSVQTPLVRAEPGNDLRYFTYCPKIQQIRLESATRSVQIHAPLGVSVESRAGDIRATCLEDLKLRSTGGSIRIDTSSLHFSNLRTASVSLKTKSSNTSPNRPTTQVYQVCICSNGRLFLTAPEGTCVADPSICS